MNNQNEPDIYIIPPNFVEGGTFFGGLFKARNVIEAGILAFGTGIPVMIFLPFSLTARIIVLCFTSLPLAILALIGISGESLSSFFFIYLKYLKNRRIVGSENDKERKIEHTAVSKRGKSCKVDKSILSKGRSRKTDFPAEFDEVEEYERRNHRAPKRAKARQNSDKGSQKRGERKHEKSADTQTAFTNSVAAYLPIEKIENGIIYTRDHRFVKIVELVPINFLLRSAREQRSIIYSFISYLKISPVKTQFKVLTRRADINRHMETVRREMALEPDERCRLMQEDYLQFVQQISSREAVTRRFFLIFEYEPWGNIKRGQEEAEAVNSLHTAVQTASSYLRQCGNEVIVPKNEDEFMVNVLYNLLCRKESALNPLPSRVKEVVARYASEGRASEINRIPATEFFTPMSRIPKRPRQMNTP